MARNGETFRELGKSVVEIQHRFRFGDVSVIVFLFFFSSLLAQCILLRSIFCSI